MWTGLEFAKPKLEWLRFLLAAVTQSAFVKASASWVSWWWCDFMLTQAVMKCINLKPPYLHCWSRTNLFLHTSLLWPVIQRESTCWSLALEVAFKVTPPNSLSRRRYKTPIQHSNGSSLRSIWTLSLNLQKRKKENTPKPTSLGKQLFTVRKQDSNRLRNSHTHMQPYKRSQKCTHRLAHMCFPQQRDTDTSSS